MADPIINEKSVLAALDRVASLKNASELKDGARLALIDAFDRRPNRDPFIELVQDGCALQANLSRLEFADILRSMLKSGKLTDELLTDTVKSLTDKCEHYRESLRKKFHLVSEMRLTDDPLH